MLINTMAHQNDPILLNNRAILTVSGPERKNFLQGLITNNIEKLAKNSAIYAALLTPQGKYLHDFFITEVDETLYLDCEKDRLADLFSRDDRDAAVRRSSAIGASAARGVRRRVATRAGSDARGTCG